MITDLLPHPLLKKYKYRHLTKPERKRIVDDMRENGFDPTRPIVVYEGMILDGNERYACANEAGVHLIPLHEFVGTELEAELLVQRCNDHRRHMSLDDLKAAKANRLPRVAELRRQGATIAEIAEEVGASKAAVMNDIEDAAEAGMDVATPPSTPESRKGKKGRPPGAKTKPKPPPVEAKWYADPEPEPKDAMGKVIPPKLRPAFVRLTGWCEAEDSYFGNVLDTLKARKSVVTLRKTAKELPHLSPDVWGDMIGGIVDGIEAILKDLKQGQPVAVCPCCEGAGCETCLQSGLLPRRLYKDAKAAAKLAAKGGAT
jgi:hypothetical protein